MAKEVDINQFIQVWNDLEKFPTVADVAEEFSISIKTARNKAGFLRGLNKGNPNGQRIAVRSVTSESPLSEDSGKFMEHWDAQDCIAGRRRGAGGGPGGGGARGGGRERGQ